MFVLADRKTRLYRYKVVYSDDEGLGIVDKCISEEEKDRLEQRLSDQGIVFVTTAIDQTANEWFEGLYFQSYDEARDVFEAGEEVYLQRQAIKEMTNNLRLRADIDFLTIMTGVEV